MLYGVLQIIPVVILILVISVTVTFPVYHFINP